MSDTHSAQTSARVCPHCTTLDIAHVGDTEKSRWLECRECGHVWNHSLPAPAQAQAQASTPARSATPWNAEQPRRWTLRDEAERRVEEYRSYNHEAAWTKDPGCPRDRWPVGGREEKDRER